MKAFELNVEKRVRIHQVREEGMGMPGRRTYTCKGIRYLTYSGTDKKLNIDGMWDWNGEEEKRLQKLGHEGRGMSC